jgi:hypothetical protein
VRLEEIPDRLTGIEIAVDAADDGFRQVLRAAEPGMAGALLDLEQHFTVESAAFMQQRHLWGWRPLPFAGFARRIEVSSNLSVCMIVWRWLQA